jgi:hypothetical protein
VPTARPRRRLSCVAYAATRSGPHGAGWGCQTQQSGRQLCGSPENIVSGRNPVRSFVESWATFWPSRKPTRAARRAESGCLLRKRSSLSKRFLLHSRANVAHRRARGAFPR